jgi:cob(I)alamin adenosyltransferase
MCDGLIHVYTGDGKGKSTAAFGLAIRACGSGKKVFIIQFLKSHPTSELKAIERFGNDVQVFRFEKPRDFVWNLNDKEKQELKNEVQEAFSFACEVMRDGKCELLILDEIMGAIKNDFIATKDLIKSLKSRKKEMEVVLTGRNVPDDILEIADYVSEVKCIKHPYEKGIPARKGIEF